MQEEEEMKKLHTSFVWSNVGSIVAAQAKKNNNDDDLFEMETHKNKWKKSLLTHIRSLKQQWYNGARANNMKKHDFSKAT